MPSDNTPDASVLKSLLSLLSSVTGDLSNITIPPFFLGPKSVTQIPASWSERPSTFAAPAHEPNPSTRALLVLKLFLTSLRTQFYIDGDTKAGIKKPLNAFLGEIYTASYTQHGSTASIISEQVSHHPPITATHIWDADAGITADGYARVEMTFNGNINIRQYGHAMLHIDRYNEDYLIPFPDAQVKGLMSGGRVYPELQGTYHIVGSSGFVSEVEFSGKGLLGSLGGGGRKNSFRAIVYRNEDEGKKAIYEVEGCWSGVFVIRDGSGTEIETVNTAVPPAEPKYAERPDPWETQEAWKDVMMYLRQGDMKAAGLEKTRLEDAQRVLRKKIPEEEWRSLYFDAKDEWYPTFDKLAQGTGLELNKEKTKGVWRINKEKAKKVERPFHGGLTPTG
jgi:hypothetical protein